LFFIKKLTPPISRVLPETGGVLIYISLRLHYQDQVIRVDVAILSASGEAPLSNLVMTIKSKSLFYIYLFKIFSLFPAFIFVSFFLDNCQAMC